MPRPHRYGGASADPALEAEGGGHWKSRPGKMRPTQPLLIGQKSVDQPSVVCVGQAYAVRRLKNVALVYEFRAAQQDPSRSWAESTEPCIQLRREPLELSILENVILQYGSELSGHVSHEGNGTPAVPELPPNQVKSRADHFVKSHPPSPFSLSVQPNAAEDAFCCFPVTVEHLGGDGTIGSVSLARRPVGERLLEPSKYHQKTWVALLEALQHGEIPQPIHMFPIFLSEVTALKATR